MDDLNLYDDLDEFHEQHEKKSKELQEAEEKYQESLKTIEELKVENKTLKKNIQRLELGFQSLLDTARSEIKRKDKEIERLRKEKDDICFRRKIPTSSPYTNSASHLINNFSVNNPFRSNEIKGNEVPLTESAVINPAEVSEEVIRKKEQHKRTCDNDDERFHTDPKRHRGALSESDDKYQHHYKHHSASQKTRDEYQSRSKVQYRENDRNKIYDKDYGRTRTRDGGDDDRRFKYDKSSRSSERKRYEKESHNNKSQERQKSGYNHKNYKERSRSKERHKTRPSETDSKRLHSKNEQNTLITETENSKKRNKDLGEKYITTEHKNPTSGNLPKENEKEVQSRTGNFANSRSQAEQIKKQESTKSPPGGHKDELTHDFATGFRKDVQHNILLERKTSERSSLCTPHRLAIFSEIFGKSPSVSGESISTNAAATPAQASEIEVISSLTTSPENYTDIDNDETTPINKPLDSAIPTSGTSCDEIIWLEKTNKDEIDKCFVPNSNSARTYKTIGCVDVQKIFDDDIGNEFDYIDIPGLDLCPKEKVNETKDNLNLKTSNKETGSLTQKVQKEKQLLTFNFNEEKTLNTTEFNRMKPKEKVEMASCDNVDKNPAVFIAKGTSAAAKVVGITNEVFNFGSMKLNICATNPTNAILQNSEAANSWHDKQEKTVNNTAFVEKVPSKETNDITTKVIVLDATQCSGAVPLKNPYKIKENEQKSLNSNTANREESSTNVALKVFQSNSKNAGPEVNVNQLLISANKESESQCCHTTGADIVVQANESSFEATNVQKSVRAERDISLAKNEATRPISGSRAPCKTLVGKNDFCEIVDVQLNTSVKLLLELNETKHHPVAQRDDAISSLASSESSVELVQESDKVVDDDATETLTREETYLHKREANTSEDLSKKDSQEKKLIHEENFEAITLREDLESEKEKVISKAEHHDREDVAKVEEEKENNNLGSKMKEPEHISKESDLFSTEPANHSVDIQKFVTAEKTNEIKKRIVTPPQKESRLAVAECPVSSKDLKHANKAEESLNKVVSYETDISQNTSLANTKPETCSNLPGKYLTYHHPNNVNTAQGENTLVALVKKEDAAPIPEKADINSSAQEISKTNGKNSNESSKIIVQSVEIIPPIIIVPQFSSCLTSEENSSDRKLEMAKSLPPVIKCDEKKEQEIQSCLHENEHTVDIVEREKFITRERTFGKVKQSDEKDVIDSDEEKCVQQAEILKTDNTKFSPTKSCLSDAFVEKSITQENESVKDSFSSIKQHCENDLQEKLSGKEIFNANVQIVSTQINTNQNSQLIVPQENKEATSKDDLCIVVQSVEVLPAKVDGTEKENIVSIPDRNELALETPLEKLTNDTDITPKETPIKETMSSDDAENLISEQQLKVSTEINAAETDDENHIEHIYQETVSTSNQHVTEFVLLKNPAKVERENIPCAAETEYLCDPMEILLNKIHGIQDNPKEISKQRQVLEVDYENLNENNTPETISNSITTSNQHVSETVLPENTAKVESENIPCEAEQENLCDSMEILLKKIHGLQEDQDDSLVLKVSDLDLTDEIKESREETQTTSTSVLLINLTQNEQLQNPKPSAKNETTKLFAMAQKDNGNGNKSLDKKLSKTETGDVKETLACSPTNTSQKLLTSVTREEENTNHTGSSKTKSASKEGGHKAAHSVIPALKHEEPCTTLSLKNDEVVDNNNAIATEVVLAECKATSVAERDNNANLNQKESETNYENKLLISTEGICGTKRKHEERDGKTPNCRSKDRFSKQVQEPSTQSVTSCEESTEHNCFVKVTETCSNRSSLLPEKEVINLYADKKTQVYLTSTAENGTPSIDNKLEILSKFVKNYPVESVTLSQQTHQKTTISKESKDESIAFTLQTKSSSKSMKLPEFGKKCTVDIVQVAKPSEEAEHICTKAETIIKTNSAEMNKNVQITLDESSQTTAIPITDGNLIAGPKPAVGKHVNEKDVSLLMNCNAKPNCSEDTIKTIRKTRSSALGCRIFDVEIPKQDCEELSRYPLSKQDLDTRNQHFSTHNEQLCLQEICSKAALNFQKATEDSGTGNIVSNKPSDVISLQTSSNTTEISKETEITPTIVVSLNADKLSQAFPDTKKTVYCKKVVSKQINIEGEIVEVVKVIANCDETETNACGNDRRANNMHLEMPCAALRCNSEQSKESTIEQQSALFETQKDVLPSISAAFPTPSNFSGIFSKTLCSSLTAGEDDLNKLKKKSPHLNTKPKEYILPAASVLCNVDNLENATKNNKKLHWELLDNKNEMSEIEDDVDIDITDTEELKIQEIPSENRCSSPKQTKLQKSSPSESDTQTEDESVLIDVEQQKGKYKNLKHTKKPEIVSQLPENLKAANQTTALRESNAIVIDSLVLPQSCLPVLPKRPVGRPRKLDKKYRIPDKPRTHKNRGRKPKKAYESSAVDSPKSIILNSKLDNYETEPTELKQNAESPKSIESLEVARKIKKLQTSASKCDRDYNSKSLEECDRNISEDIRSMEYSMRSLSSSVEKLEICDEPCSSRDSFKQRQPSKTKSPDSEIQDEYNTVLLYEKQHVPKNVINSEFNEEVVAKFTITGNLDKNSALSTKSKEKQNNFVNKDCTPDDKTKELLIEENSTGDVLNVVPNAIAGFSKERTSVEICTADSSCSELEKTMNSKFASISPKNKGRNCITLEDIGIKVRPPKLHLSSFRIPKIKKSPDDLLDVGCWKLEKYVKLKSAEDKSQTKESNQHEQVIPDRKLTKQNISKNSCQLAESADVCQKNNEDKSGTKLNTMILLPKDDVQLQTEKMVKKIPDSLCHTDINFESETGRRKEEKGDTKAKSKTESSSEQYLKTTKISEPDLVKHGRKHVHFSGEKPIKDLPKLQEKILDSSSDAGMENVAKKRKLSTNELNKYSQNSQQQHKNITTTLNENNTNELLSLDSKTQRAERSNVERTANPDIKVAKSTKNLSKVHRTILDSSSDEDMENVAKKINLNTQEFSAGSKKNNTNQQLRLRRKSLNAERCNLERALNTDMQVDKPIKKHVNLQRRILDSSSDEDIENATNKMKLSAYELHKTSQISQHKESSKTLPQDQALATGLTKNKTDKVLRLRTKSLPAESFNIEIGVNIAIQEDKRHEDNAGSKMPKAQETAANEHKLPDQQPAKATKSLRLLKETTKVKQMANQPCSQYIQPRRVSARHRESKITTQNIKNEAGGKEKTNNNIALPAISNTHHQHQLSLRRKSTNQRNDVHDNRATDIIQNKAEQERKSDVNSLTDLPSKSTSAKDNKMAAENPVIHNIRTENIVKNEDSENDKNKLKRPREENEIPNHKTLLNSYVDGAADAEADAFILTAQQKENNESVIGNAAQDKCVVEEKPKRRRRRVVKVLSSSMDSANTSTNVSHQSSHSPSPFASPLLSHPIFNTEVSTQSTEFALTLPLTPNQQNDSEFKEIDSKLNELFKSPIHTADDTDKNLSVLASSNTSIQLSPLLNSTNVETTDLIGENECSSVNNSQLKESSLSCNETQSLHNNSEVKYLSMGSSKYRFEKVSDNVVNLFITRKRKRKSNN